MYISDKKTIFIITALVIMGFVLGILWGRFITPHHTDLNPIVSERTDDVGENGLPEELAGETPMPGDVLQRIP